MSTTNRFGVTTQQQAENLVELLAYCAGYIAEPGDWDVVEHADLDADCDEPLPVECPAPKVTAKWWRSRAA